MLSLGADSTTLKLIHTFSPTNKRTKRTKKEATSIHSLLLLMSSPCFCFALAFLPVNITAIPGDAELGNTVLHFAGDATYPPSASRGLFTIYYSNTWGTMCDDVVADDPLAADIICRQLGWHTRVPQGMFYQPAVSYADPLSMGQNDAYGPILLDDVRCFGNETNIGQCPHSNWYDNNCNHDEDVVIECISPILRSMSIPVLQDNREIVVGSATSVGVFVSPTISSSIPYGTYGWDSYLTCGRTGTDRIPWDTYHSGRMKIFSGITSGYISSNVTMSFMSKLLIGSISCSLDFSSGDSRYNKLSYKQLRFTLIDTEFIIKKNWNY